ncbi:MAG: DUF4197 domain-containing protein [Flavobacteriaceae bacterium]|nr:MAG: DUF4197 domain-containing protein [Flavobacteriaceae bacterium]
MKKIVFPLVLLSLSSCTELQQAAQVAEVATQIPGVLNQDTAQKAGKVLDVYKAATGGTTTGTLTQTQIGEGLREALDLGIKNQVSNLTKSGGFLNNDMVKILFPPELKKVDTTLRQIGLGSLADKGIQSLNAAAENAVKQATPIFVDAVKNITFTDALTLLKGGDNAATNFLKQKTEAALYQKFYPEIQASMGKVGADGIWKNLISQYNALPTATKVNPDLNDYVTKQALSGVFTMIAKEEADIRANPAKRTSELLKSVFSLQD